MFDTVIFWPLSEDKKSITSFFQVTLQHLDFRKICD